MLTAVQHQLPCSDAQVFVFVFLLCLCFLLSGFYCACGLYLCFNVFVFCVCNCLLSCFSFLPSKVAAAPHIVTALARRRAGRFFVWFIQNKNYPFFWNSVYICYNLKQKLLVPLNVSLNQISTLKVHKAVCKPPYTVQSIPGKGFGMVIITVFPF